MEISPERRLMYVWDYELTEAQFLLILRGQRRLGRLDQEWAARRLLEHAPYDEIVRLLGFAALVQHWPRWRSKVTSESRRRGLDFLTEWVEQQHPEWLNGGAG
jgi:hypothetical protein